MSKYTEEQIKEVIRLKKAGVTHRDIAEIVFGRRSMASSIFYILNDNFYGTADEKRHIARPNILIFDIETTPEVSYTWGRFKQNVAPSQVIERSRFICSGFKWAGMVKPPEAVVNTGYLYLEGLDSKERQAALDIHEYTALLDTWKYLDKADAVVAHNGRKFDTAYLNTKFLEYGIPLPSPYKIIDTMLISKRMFGFKSNSLAELSAFLKVGGKDSMSFSDWREVMEGSDKALDKMVTYCLQDVNLLEEVYYALRPYDNQHINLGLYQGERGETLCPTCGSSDIDTDGTYSASASLFAAHRCNSCQAIFRADTKINSVRTRLIPR